MRFRPAHRPARTAPRFGRSNPTAPQTPTQTVIAPPTAREFCRLELLDNPAISFEIAPDQTVGRGIEADVILAEVPHAGYISRQHARFSRRGAQWFVQYLGQGNFITVDGETAEDDSQLALHHGSVLVLSLTSFRVVLE